MIICVSLYKIPYYRSLNFRFVFDSRHGMPNAQCAVVGCTSSFADLRKWRKQKCVFHLIPKNDCPCRELYELLKFPKDEATKLSWEKDSIELKLWIEQFAMVNVYFFIKKVNHGVPTPPMLSAPTTSSMTCLRKNPFSDCNMGYEHVNRSSKRRKGPVYRANYQQSQSATDISICEDPTSTQCIVPSYNVADQSIISLDHSYSVNTCQCKNDCCQVNRKKLACLNEKISKCELALSEHSINPKRKIIHSHVLTIDSSRIDIHSVLCSNENVRFFTGLPSVEVFELLFEFLSQKVSTMALWRGHKHAIKSKGRSQNLKKRERKLTSKQELVLVLMKLKLGLVNKDLALRFGISPALVSSIFISWVRFLADVLSFLSYWPDVESTRANLPKCFKSKYPRLRATLDCTEFFLERPSDLELQNVTWSDYKHHNTIKSLVAITPRGSFSYVSECWGGRASDRQITVESRAF